MSVVEPALFNTNIFNTEAYISSTEYATVDFCNRTYLKLVGGSIFGSLNIANDLSLTGALSKFYITNNTEASVSSITGCMRLSGGAYFGNSCYINGDLIANSINALNSLEISGSGHLTVSASSHIKINNTSDATAFTNASIYSKGGIYLEKSIIALGTNNQFKSILMNGDINVNFNSLYNARFIWTDNVNTSNLDVSGIFNANYLALNNSNDSLIITNSSSTGRSNIKCVNDTGLTMEFGIRGSASSNANNTYIYFNGAYKLLMNSTGDTKILSTTGSTSISTGALTVAGGLGVAENLYCQQLKLNYATSQIVINNTNSGDSALIEVPGSPTILRLVCNNIAVNIGGSGLRIGTSTTSASAAYKLDFGNTAADCIIKFYDGYFIGANNSALQFSSASDHIFYKNTSNTLGVKLATINEAGNIISQAGIHANSFSSSGLAAFGSSAHMHFGGGIASYFGYNYSSNTWLTTQIGSCCYVCPKDGTTGTFGGLSINSTSYVAPLYVNGSQGITRNPTTSYGFLAKTGAGTASTAFTNRPFSAYFESGLFIESSEINCYSDLRVKKDITNITTERALKFLEMNPINFKYINGDETLKVGYSAQQLLSACFYDIVGLTVFNGKDILEKEDVECEDGTIIHLQKDEKLVLNIQATIPYLHKALKESFNLIKEQQKQIDKLYELIYKKL